MKHYSQSEIKAWRRCQKSHEYKHIQELSRKTSPVALLRGTTLHAMLEANIKGEDWKPALQVYRETYDELWGEERENYPSPEELESIYTRYQQYYANDGLDYGGRAEVVITAEKDGIGFKGIIDALPDDSEGRRWLSDHKTHKVLPDEHTRFSDIQTVLYYWACRESGMKVDGILWDYLRTKPPSVPEVLKSGGLSKRANIDTDYETYLKAINDNGLNPDDYRDILEKVKGNTFFKRIKLPNPPNDLINSVVDDFFATAREIEEHGDKPRVRNLTRDCKSCSYYQLCSAEVRGLDSSFIKKQMYTVRIDNRYNSLSTDKPIK